MPNLEMKRQGHRRERGGSGLLYNGFLFCDTCGSPMMTVAAKKHHGLVSYYVCRNRKNPGKWGPKCPEPYMLGRTLEQRIDDLLGRHVTSMEFATRMARKMRARAEDKRDAAKVSRLEAETRFLETMRSRVVDSFVDGIISRESRDERLRGIGEQIRSGLRRV